MNHLTCRSGEVIRDGQDMRTAPTSSSCNVQSGIVSGSGLNRGINRNKIESMKEAPFAIMSRVVAIKDAECGLWEKGDVFRVLDVTQCSGCKTFVIDIGIKVIKGNGTRCSKCGNNSINSDYRWLCNPKSFAPYDPPAIEIPAELLKEPKQDCIDVNIKELV